MAEAASSREEPSLRLRRILPASIDRVFRAWTDPEQLKAWLVPEGSQLLSAEVDIRVGGDYRLAFRAADGEILYAVGSYVEVDPPVRLVFTWVFEGVDHRETLVTVDLRASGESTELILTHERFTTKAFRAFHEAGWTSALDRFAEFLSPTYT